MSSGIVFTTQLLSRLALQVTKWRESYYEAYQLSQQFQAKFDECTAQLHRERETYDALQRVSRSS